MMDPHSNLIEDDEILPAEEIVVLPSSQDWRPAAKRSWAHRIGHARFACAWLAIALIGASIIWSLTWFQPQRQIHLSLIGASYCDNLSVNHNVYGWKDLTRLAALANHDPLLNQFAAASSPTALSRNVNWDAELNQADEETIVVYFSAHGSADANGAFLLPLDCQPADSSRLEVASIIQRLGRIPAHKKKLLILDASHFHANWQYGVLENDFSRAVSELNEQILAVPNLVVLCATGEGQIAWDCAAQDQSAFGHFLTEGIRGAAADLNDNGRIDAEDVFKYTQSSVHQWVQTTFQKTQVPTLLPAGQEGLHRASRLELATVRLNYQPPEPTANQPRSDDQLIKIWNAYHALLSHPIKPYAYAPGRWRQYEQSILRYEQLVHANDIRSANQLVERISSLQHQFEWEQEDSAMTGQGNLFLGKAILGHSGNREEAQQVTDQLWTAAPNQYASKWKQIAGDHDAGKIARLRTEVLTLLYERAIADPVTLLAKSAEIATHIIDALEPVPAEVNFLQMVNRHLPAASRNEASAELIRTALEVRLLAEKVAVTYQPDARATSEGIFPWIEDDVLAADQLRLLGEDLMFAGTAEHGRAADYFEQSSQAYLRAHARGARVRAAYLLSQQLCYRLPHFSSWIADLNVNSSKPDQQRLLNFENLVANTHQLNALLATQDPAFIDAPPTDPQVAGQSRSLADQTDVVAADFGLLQKRFDDWWQDQSAAHTPDLWHDINLALSIPYGQPESRITLLNSQRNLMRAHPASTSQPGIEDHWAQPQLKPSELEPIELAQLKADSVHRACTQGRLALALIGERAFAQARPDTASDSEETFVQLQHRLNVLGTEEHWWNSIHTSGLQIADCLNRISQQVADSAAATTNQFDSLLVASAMDRFLSGNGRPAPVTGPNSRLRDFRISRLLGGLARRALNDHWYDISERPYFKESAGRYLRTATRLWQENPELSQLEQAIESSAELVIISPSQLDLTTEMKVPFEIGVRWEAHARDINGFPLLWLEESGSLALTRPLVGEKLVQRLERGRAPTPEACLLQNPIVSEQVSSGSGFAQSPFRAVSHREASSNSVAGSNPSVRVAGFFRGQPLANTITVNLHRTPEVVNFEFEKPRTARLAVVASESMQQLHGTGSGAVAIVLDASGSMGAAAGKQFDESTKYAEATRAIREVLASLPDSIQLSIWVFGQATGPQKTVRAAEQTIRRVVGPTTWNVADKGQLEAVMKTIAWPNIEPWNESPIVECVLAARQDVVGKEGFKSVLLLTDGMDNRFENRSHEEQPITVAQALRTAFDQSDISLNVVGFKVNSKEQQQARRQFSVVEEFSPSGTYFEVRDSRQLADTLKSVLHQRVKYWIDDYANAPLSTTESNASDAGTLSPSMNWYPSPLAPGSYSLWTNTSPKPFPVLLNRGDQLVVELDHQDHRLVCRRPSLLDSQFAHKPAKTTSGWKVAALQNRLIADSNELSMLVGLEQIERSDPVAVELIRPQSVWFEVHQAGDLTSTSPTTWYVDHTFPIPTWQLSVANWSKRLAGHRNTPVSPVVDVWWIPDRAMAAAVRFERGRDYEKISQLAGRKIDIEGVPVEIESVGVEHRFVQVSPTNSQERACLVVRIKHAPDHKFIAKPLGSRFEGSEQRSYQQIGRFTGVFWPVTEDQVDDVVSGLNVFALDDFKRQAEARGLHVQLDKLPPPRPDDVAFPPLNGSLNR